MLIVSIDKAKLNSKDKKSFVTYQFYDQADVFTKALMGDQPNYNFVKKHEIIYDQELQEYLRTQKLEFQIFDDNVPIMPVTTQQDDDDAMPSDFIGRVLVPIDQLT